MSQGVQLRGVAWDHTRGYLPMVAAAQRFEDLFPDLRITWEKRSLQSFGDEGLDAAVEQFDLLVIDHPYVGEFASRPLVRSLVEHLPAAVVDELRDNAIGSSFESYWFAGKLWAVPIDAAAPVSSAREDLLAKAGVALPQCWEDICALARRQLVILPATPVDSLMNFYMLCCGLGEDPFAKPGCLVSPQVGAQALQLLRDLIVLCSPECLSRNPIQTYRRMATSEDAAYCPFAFGYSNYSRAGYLPASLRFGDLVTLYGRSLRSTLGGAGLAISARCRNLPWALQFLEYTASGSCQQTLYYASGGQPAHRTAWLDSKINADCLDFFTRTLPVLDRAYLRPRHNGYLLFQQGAGLVIHRFLREGGDARNVFDELENLVPFVI